MTSRCAAYDARIRQLVAEGRSSVQIAADIGHGLTKGMIVGWCDRRHIERRQKISQHGKDGRFAAAVREMLELEQTQRPKGTPTNPQPWHRNMQAYGEIGPAPKTCRYIHGDPAVKGWRWCGKAVEQGSYCRKHFRITHVRVKGELQPTED